MTFLWLFMIAKLINKMKNILEAPQSQKALEVPLPVKPGVSKK